MSTARMSRIAVVLFLLVLMAACSRDPYATALPLNAADISAMQAQLDELPPDERQLVLDYLKRSKGDVLPANLADPDAPLTARTFGEAIKLQREFNAKRAVEADRESALQARREDAMEPLRQALQIELVRREILSADAVSGRQPAPGQAINSRPVLVNTFRVTNHAAETITQVSGAVTVRTVTDPDSLMGISNCYIARSEPIAAAESVEVRCANPAVAAGASDEAYVAMPEDSLVLDWQPKSITFASGEVMTAAQ